MNASVIITVYNLERYAALAIESVLRQSRAAFEIIVVDDASIDGSREIVRRFEGQVALVRNDRNLGVMRTTLAGIATARADVICVLDGDDEWAPGKLDAVLSRFEQDERLAIISHDCQFIDAAGRTVLARDPGQAALRRVYRTSDGDKVSDVMRDSVLEYRGLVWLGSAWAFRRTALDLKTFVRRVEAYERPDQLYQDHPLATYLLLSSNGRCGYVDEPLLRYRVHGSNYSGAATDIVRARRIVAMGRATTQFTCDLVAEYAPGELRALAAQRTHLQEFDYYEALYAGDLKSALGLYRKCVRSGWSLPRSLKEALRVGCVAALGLERFFLLKGILSRAR